MIVTFVRYVGICWQILTEDIRVVPAFGCRAAFGNSNASKRANRCSRCSKHQAPPPIPEPVSE